MREFTSGEISDICADYRRLKNKKDLKTIAELHACRVPDVAAVLRDNGFVLDAQPVAPVQIPPPIEELAAPATGEPAKRPRRVSPGTREPQLRQLAAEGLTRQEAADRLGMRYSALSALARKYKIVFPPARNIKRAKDPAPQEPAPNPAPEIPAAPVCVDPPAAIADDTTGASTGRSDMPSGEIRDHLVALTGHIDATKIAIIQSNLGLAGINAEKAVRDLKALVAAMRRTGIV